MGLNIHLLGSPRVTLDGVPGEPPRGRKAWALLAYLLRSTTPPSREAIAGLLCPEADDPLGALRSILAEVRRLLGAFGAAGGDPIEVALAEDTIVDVDTLLSGSWEEAVSLDGFGRPFLEGVNPAASAAFELWLANERRHLAAASEGILHEAALATLAGGDAAGALDLSARLVELSPLDENAQALHVRCLALAGHIDQARRQVEACTALFRRELGVDPTPAVREAAQAHRLRAGPGGPGAIRAQLEAGEASVAAGAVEAGLGTLQQAAVNAEAESPDLLAKVLVTLGSALVHAARGSDEEGAAVLHRAIEASRRSGDGDLAATAHRELGYVELLRGQYSRAEGWLSRAEKLARPDGEERIWISAVEGAVRTDIGEHAAAHDRLSQASQRAQDAGAERAEGWARSFLGRLFLLRGELGAARTELERSIEIARAEDWNSFLPWPESLLAEVDLKENRIDRAAEGFDHAFAMGCQLTDPCWESIAARGLGLVAAANDELGRAVELLSEAPGRCRRLPDSYRWIEAYAMAALAEVAVGAGLAEAHQWVGELEALASRLGMREFVATAAVLRARLGDETALGTAALLAAEVDNPALHEYVRTAMPA